MNHHLTLVASILLSASCHSCFVQITGGIPQGSILQCFFNYFVCERIIYGLLTEITEVSVVKGFDVQSVKMWERSFNDDLKKRLVMNAVTQNGIPSVARNRTDVDNINFMFSNQIDTAEATDQERSGRCSLFLRA